MHLYQTHFANPSLSAVESPLCLRCQDRMVLVGVALGPLELERWIFECRECEPTTEATVSLRPSS
jgi:hypothetical protein